MAIVKKYKAKIISVKNLDNTIFTVEFQSLNGAFKFLPGQFLHLALDEYDPSSNWPESRCFSIQSPVSNPLLKITFSVKGNFTQRLAKELLIGKILDIKLPFGELFQQEHSRANVVFIAGGTGITPLLSLFNDPVFSHYISPVLYFGAKNKSFNIYKEQLILAKQINNTLIVKEKYQDIDGILDIEEIFNENGIDKTYFISGPQAMIKSFRAYLKSKGLSENKIKTDDWE